MKISQVSKKELIYTQKRDFYRRGFIFFGDYNAPVARVVRDYNQPQQRTRLPSGDGEKSRSPSERGA